MKIMFPEFKKNIQDHELVQAGDTIILGFSGGKDSVALAALLPELQKHIPFRLVAAYFNHGLRGDRTAAQEEAAVRRLAASLEVPVVAGHGNAQAPELCALEFHVPPTRRPDKRRGRRTCVCARENPRPAWHNRPACS